MDRRVPLLMLGLAGLEDRKETLVQIAVFVECFPVVSETFIIRQIVDLIESGHDVDIFADHRPESCDALHPEVTKYGLLSRTTYMDIPPASGYWEAPVWPITGQTWLPGASKSLLNGVRLLHVMPALIKCLLTAPKITHKVLTEYGHQSQSLSSLYRLDRLCRIRKKYGVLHAHFGPVGNKFRFAGELWKAPFFVTFHGYDFCAVPLESGPHVYDKLFRTADTVTVISEYARERIEQLGCAAAKIRRLPMGIDTAEFQFQERNRTPADTVRILTVARFVAKKGLEYSIRAIAEVAKTYHNIQYDIVGDGPLWPELEALIHQLGMEQRIKLHGARDTEYVRKMMATAHVFMLTSVTAANGDQEGAPVTLMEAQACGLPVVSTKHSGIPEVVIDGKSGFLLPEREVDGLVDCLELLISQPNLCSEMGRYGRKHVERHYNLRSLTRQLEAMYAEAESRQTANV